MTEALQRFSTAGQLAAGLWLAFAGALIASIYLEAKWPAWRAWLRARARRGKDGA